MQVRRDDETRDEMGMTTERVLARQVSGELRGLGHVALASGSSRMREGIRVSGGGSGGRVLVTVDYDDEQAATVRAEELRGALAGTGRWAVEQDGQYLTVTKAGAA